MSPLTLSQDDFLNRLPLGVCVYDAAGCIASFNAKAVEIWGRAPQDGECFLGGACCDASGMAVTPAESPAALALKSQKPQRNCELLFQRPNGAPVAALSTVEPLLGEGGVLLGAVEVLQDISDRKRSEEARRVAARVAAYARLAESVSEKILDPLTSVNKLLERLREENNLSVEARSCADHAAQGLLRLDQLAREIMLYCNPA